MGCHMKKSIEAVEIDALDVAGFGAVRKDHGVTHPLFGNVAV